MQPLIPDASPGGQAIQRRLRLCPEVVRREVAYGFRRTLDRTRAQAGRDVDRAEQATCGAGSEGDPRARRAT